MLDNEAAEVSDIDRHRDMHLQREWDFLRSGIWDSRRWSIQGKRDYILGITAGLDPSASEAHGLAAERRDYLIGVCDYLAANPGVQDLSLESWPPEGQRMIAEMIPRFREPAIPQKIQLIH